MESKKLFTGKVNNNKFGESTGGWGCRVVGAGALGKLKVLNLKHF